MKKIILTLLPILLLASCNPTQEEVVLTYANGNPELVYLVKGKDDNRHIVGEKMYYENGQLRADKHFSTKDEQPEGTWHYYYSDGTTFAQGEFDATHPLGSHWQFFKKDSQPYHTAPCDSLVVLELNAKQMPATVAYYTGDSASIYKFYEDYSLQSEGLLLNNQRHGKWFYYYPDGTIQVEATFINGIENGAYKCFRENGIPIYLGYYINGKRANIWEFYDMEGNLSGTKNFDAPAAI